MSNITLNYVIPSNASTIVLMTTEKDFVRLDPANAEGIEVVKVTVEWGDSAGIDRILSAVISNG